MTGTERRLARIRSRDGVSLVEVMLVACLFGVVLAAVAGFASAQSRLLARARDATRAQELVRTTSVVLTAELRDLDPSDIAAVGPDSVRIRAVRGGGVICDSDASSIVVRYRGARQPNPAKDSIVVVHEGSTAGSARPLLGVARDPRCGGALRLEVEEPAAAGWVLVFETGSYHIAGHAFRYRRGHGGRQALTEELLDGGSFQPIARGLRFALAFARDSLAHLDSTAYASAIRLANPGPP